MPAQSQNGPGPHAAEAVVRQAFEAHAGMRWDSVAALMHPEALRRFHLAQIQHQRMREQLRNRAVGERNAPGMPAEVRAWFDEQQRRLEAQHPSGVAADFAGVASVAELEALSPEAAFACWLEAHDARALLTRQKQGTGRTIPPELPLAEMHPVNRIVGSVIEDDSTVQVLYRTRPPGEEPVDNMDRLATATVRRAAEKWRIWTTHDDPQLFGMENWVIGVDLPEERAERLRETAQKVFAWPDGGTPRVRASIRGYAGDARAPEVVVLEVAQPDGTMARVELPYGVLTPLWEFLQDWMYLPAEGGQQH